MFYRVVVNLNFNREDIPERAYRDARWLLQNAIVVNPGQPNEERGYIELQQCFHDEDPTRPCVILRHVEPD